VWEQRIGEARTDIEMCRLLTLKAAYMMDTVGNKVAANEIAMIKVAGPRIACKIIDDAIQAHGGGGVTSDFGLARSYASIRTLRLADGPDGSALPCDRPERVQEIPRQRLCGGSCGREVHGSGRLALIALQHKLH